MKRLTYLILILCVGFIIIDRLGGFIMEKIAQNPNNSRILKLNYMINDMDDELLLFGTSRILHALDPEIIKDSVGFSVFNCGISGGKNIYVNYMLLNYVLQHHIPKLIILEINPDDFLKIEEPHKIGKFSHLYGRNEECDSFLTKVTGYKGLRFSHLYRYNNISKQLILGVFQPKKKWRRDGFEPLKTTRKELTKFDLVEKTYKESDIDNEPLKIFYMFFEKCRRNGIMVILVSIPEFKLIDDVFYEPVKVIANKFNFPFFDYHADLGFEKNHEYFSDKLHLKKESATELSYIFSHDLKTYLSRYKLNFNSKSND